MARNKAVTLPGVTTTSGFGKGKKKGKGKGKGGDKTQQQLVDEGYKPKYGTYDPALDQQMRAADRGLGYLLDDTGKAGERATVDYGLGKDNIERESGRGLADLLTSRTRGTEDYQRQLTDLSRSYDRIGNTQVQQQAAAGVVSGGVARQSAQKRAANQAHDTLPISTNYQRFADDSATAQTRLGENKTTALGGLLLDYQRGSEDRTSTGQRAQAENTFYGQDINELRVDQAKQAGLLPTYGSQHPNTPNPKKRRRNQAVTLPGLSKNYPGRL